MADELDDDVNISEMLDAENIAVEGGSSQPPEVNRGVETSTTPVGPAKTYYDPGRRAADPFDYSRNLRLQAATLFQGDPQMQAEYVNRGNKQMASEALRLDQLLFDPDKGFLTKGPVDYSWRLASLAREEKADRDAFAELHGKKTKVIANHHAAIAGLEKRNLDLQLRSLGHQQDYHDVMSQDLQVQLEESEKLKKKYQPLEKKFLTLMDRLYTGMDHALDGGTIYDTVDTTTVFNPDTEQWETVEDTSWGGVAAVSAATLGIAANFLLTIASEGKVPMVMDRLVFGIADRSLNQQKAKIEKYRTAGKAVQSLYGTLLGQLESEKAADNAFFAVLYKRHEHNYQMKSTIAESDLAANGYKILRQQAEVKRHEYELGTKQALQSHAMSSRQQERAAATQFQQTQSVFRTSEAQRLEMLRLRTAPPAELAAERKLDWKIPKMTVDEQNKLGAFRIQMNYLTKAMVLVEKLEPKYGLDNTLAGSLLDVVRKKINIAKTEVGADLTDEYALSEIGKLAAQKYGRVSDTGNMAVEELKYWIERFFKGDEALSTVKYKIAEFYEQTLANVAGDYKMYATLGNTAKANVLGIEMMRATNNAWDSVDDVVTAATDPEVKAQIWNDYYIRMAQQGDGGYWAGFKKRLDEEIRVGMGEVE